MTDKMYVHACERGSIFGLYYELVAQDSDHIVKDYQENL